MAKNNGLPTEKIVRLKTHILKNPQRTKQTTNTIRWATFTYYSPAIRKITNFFTDSNVRIAFRTTNTIIKQLTSEKNINKNSSGIYKLKCNTCNGAYIGQTGEGVNTRYKEHIRYIKTNNPQSAYATHILQNTYEFGPENETLQLVKACKKRMPIGSWEAMLIQ